MTDHGELLAEIAHHVAELTRPFTHVAVHDVYDTRGHRAKPKFHRTTVHSLLDQVRQQVFPGRGGDGVFVAAPYTAREPAELAALDCLARIEGGAQGWVLADPGLDLRGTAEGNLAACVGIATGLDDRRLYLLASDVAGWHRLARIVTDWEAPAWRPRAPCPRCDRFGLWIRLDSHDAGCTKCLARWDRATIGVLAEHVRAHNGHDTLAG